MATFKSNVLKKHFQDGKLPSCWQRVLKEVGEILEISPKNFYGWDFEIQLATVFVAKLDGTCPSKKNLFKLGRELNSYRGKGVFGSIQGLTKEGRTEVLKTLNRPAVCVEMLHTNHAKDITKGSANETKVSKEVQPLVDSIYLTKEEKSLWVAAKQAVGKDISYYAQHHGALTWLSKTMQAYNGKAATLKGKVGNIAYSVEKSNRTLFLDAASDCCQGVGKVGYQCMNFGHRKENSSFLVFERKGKIFAQAWFYELRNGSIIVLDSIETKGELNGSLISALTVAIKELKSMYKHVVVGTSPHSKSAAINSSLYKMGGVYNELDSSDTSPVSKELNHFLNSTEIYSDIYRGYVQF